MMTSRPLRQFSSTGRLLLRSFSDDAHRAVVSKPRPRSLFSDPFFDDFFGKSLGHPAFSSVTSHFPRLDISEAKDGSQITVEAELAGMSKDDIKVSLKDGLLTISGEKKEKSETTEDTFHRLETSYGSFSRAIQLPRSVDPSKVNAKYEDGVLKLTIPMEPEQDASKTIEIQ